jgi:hypothetical protein
MLRQTDINQAFRESVLRNSKDINTYIQEISFHHYSSAAFTSHTLRLTVDRALSVVLR